jgi:hypothetical protein
MTYYPYFRGKQYELIVIREMATLIAKAEFIPIIEPVKEVLNGLEKALEAVCEAKGKAIVIINPHHGDHSEDGEDISELLGAKFLQNPEVSVGILLKEDTTLKTALGLIAKHKKHEISLIHSGFTDAKGIAEALGGSLGKFRQIFIEEHCGKLYRKHFADCERILVRDGFERRRNRDHPEVELFSDLHVTYEEEGMQGFGDFLTVGDDFSEGGGPAYAVAIHLTFIDSSKEDAMFVYHFVSDRQDTPTDPAGKFGEALDKMFKELKKPKCQVYATDAITEFRELHTKRHFPGLGYAKKLSMKHHIETFAQYFER